MGRGQPATERLCIIHIINPGDCMGSMLDRIGPDGRCKWCERNDDPHYEPCVTCHTIKHIYNLDGVGECVDCQQERKDSQ